MKSDFMSHPQCKISWNTLPFGELKNKSLVQDVLGKVSLERKPNELTLMLYIKMMPAQRQS